MENQLIREQVFDVLFNYVKRADGIYTESDCATVRDEICLQIDQSQFTADEAEEHINQEVERRIAERMPVLIKYWSRRRVVDDPDLEELLRLDDLFKSIYQANRRIDFGMAADMGMECVIKEIFRSRLTTPGVNDSQKTEGGGE